MMHSSGLLALALRRFLRNRTGVLSLTIVALFAVMILLSGFGLIGADWNTQVAGSFAAPSVWPGDAAAENIVLETESTGPVLLYGAVDPLEPVIKTLKAQHVGSFGGKIGRPETGLAERPLLFGADKWGRSVLLKVVKGAETSVLVGLFSALVATGLGTLLGALAGYWGRTVDALTEWVYGVMTAIPYLLLVFAIAAVLQKKGLLSIVLILGLTGWTGVYRLIRAEYMKHKAREYVLAASAMGASHLRRMFTHILPNTAHVILVQLSQQVVNFIKAEVILSFLGFGVPVDVVSWGSILNETPNELILGYPWQLLTCGLAMAVLVTAFALLTDALRDALDPRLK